MKKHIQSPVKNLSRLISLSNIISPRYLLPITQNKVNVGGKFGICFVKCRKDRKVVYYINVERKGRCAKKAII